MLPKTSQGENKHRQEKREKEIAVVINSITAYFNKQKQSAQNLEILEFGSGQGFQVPYLQKLGKLKASDIYESQEIKNIAGINFTLCSITDTPFQDNQFDLIFSSQVIEHIEDLGRAFREMRRIGKPDCLYAFTVPTNWWLLVSVPAQYIEKLRVVKKKMIKTAAKPGVQKIKKLKTDNSAKIHKSLFKKICFILLPFGHGVKQNFFSAYRAFKIKRWQKLFRDNSFEIIKTEPLLLYSASAWPLVPTTAKLNKYNICSSVLFLMRKK